MRERNESVIDVAEDESAIKSAIHKAMQVNRFSENNIYGDGNADVNIVSLLSCVSISNDLLNKSNAY